MQKNGSHKRFRGDVWFDEQVHKRVKESLANQEVKFVRDHKLDTDEQLLEYVRQFSKELGHIPHSGEVIGGQYISTRFGNWEAVLDAAGLPHPGAMPRSQHRHIYKQEFKRQATLLQGERREVADEKRLVVQERTAVAQKEKQEREERDLAWGCEHEGDTDEQLLAYLRQCAEELGHSPVTREVVGGAFISKRLINWPVALTLAGVALPQGMKEPKQKDLNEYRRRKKKAAAAANTTETENTPRNAVDIDDQEIKFYLGGKK